MPSELTQLRKMEVQVGADAASSVAFGNLVQPQLLLHMHNLLLLSSTVWTVPDNGMTAVLLSGGLLSLGLAARFLKNRKK